MRLAYTGEFRRCSLLLYRPRRDCVYLKMLPRLPHLSFSLVLTLLLLASFWSTATPLEDTLTVDLTDTAARNKSVEAPEVCYVLFIYPDGYNSQDQSCESLTGQNNCTVNTTNTNRAELYMTFTSDGADDITFNVTFDPEMEINCSTYIPNVLAGSSGSAVQTCRPVYSCNNPTRPELEVLWWRFDNETEFNNFFNDLDKELSSDVHEVKARPNIATITGNFNETLELDFSAKKRDLVGYYLPTFKLMNEDKLWNGQKFIVYMNPEVDDDSGDQKIIVGFDERRNFRGIFCRFLSFPDATVTWDTPRGELTIYNSTNSSCTVCTEDIGTRLDIEEEKGPTVSRGGRLVFEEVQYEDGGDYTCTAENELSDVPASKTLRFRVWDRLRPLWPAIGIVGSFLITALFIFGGALVDRVRGKQGIDDDDGSFQRNYSVVSNLGEETGSGGEKKRTRKHQSAGKRTSITQQELLANAADIN